MLHFGARYSEPAKWDYGVYLAIHRALSDVTRQNQSEILLRAWGCSAERANWGMDLDVTDRYLAEEALRESRDFAVSILDSLGEHIAVLDENGLITCQVPPVYKRV